MDHRGKETLSCVKNEGEVKEQESLGGFGVPSLLSASNRVSSRSSKSTAWDRAGAVVQESCEESAVLEFTLSRVVQDVCEA